MIPPLFSGILPALTYSVLILTIVLISAATVYTVKWCRVLANRRWWAFIFSGTTLYIITIIVTITSISLRTFSGLLNMVIACAWCAGGVIMSAGVIGMYRENKKKGGMYSIRLRNLQAEKLCVMLLLLWLAINIAMWSERGLSRSYDTIAFFLILAGQGFCIVFIYYALLCYRAYKAKPFFHLSMLSVSMFMATSANMYVTLINAGFWQIFEVNLFFYCIAASLFLFVSKKFTDIIRPEVPMLSKKTADVPLRDDILLLGACSDFTSLLISTVTPMIGIEKTRHVFRNVSAKNEVIRHCIMNDDGTTDPKMAITLLNTLDETESVIAIIKGFSAFSLGIAGIYSDVTSEKLVNQTFEDVINRMKGHIIGGVGGYEILQRHGFLLKMPGVDENIKTEIVTEFLFKKLFSSLLMECSRGTVDKVRRIVTNIHIFDDGGIDAATICEKKTVNEVITAFSKTMKECYQVVKDDLGDKADKIFSKFFSDILRMYGEVLHKYNIFECVPEDVNLYGGIRPGRTYIIEERKPDKSFGFFNKIMDSGFKGLCISRMHPDMVRDKYGYTGDIRWLSKTDEKFAVNPSNMVMIAHAVEEFLKKGNGIIILDGIEYMIINRDFQVVLRMIEDMNDMMMKKKAIMIIPITPDVFSKKEMELLRRNTETVKYED